MDNLAELWLQYKRAEQEATDRRRDIEDIMLANNRTDWAGYKVKVTTRDNWKIDGDKLQEVAAAHGLTDHLGRLFRWKPEINMTLWKASSPSITDALSKAITVTPGRASFAITKET